MKRLVLTGIATVALALGAVAQGIVGVDNLTTAYGVAANTAGTYYSGTYGLELWELNASAVPAGINVTPGPGSGASAYAAMTAAGYSLEGTFANQTMTTPGTFSLNPTFTMKDATPGGANVVVALAVWNTSDASWAAMLGAAGAATRAGVLSFVSATEAVPSGPPLPGPSLSTGWTTAGTDLVMTTVPEPGTLALAGLGMAALLIFRRRK